MLGIKNMRVELALFDGDKLLERVSINCGAEPSCDHFKCFHIAHQLNSDMAKVVLSSFSKDIDLKTSTLNMPVHQSDDWESIDFAGYTLAFRCSLNAQPSIQADAASPRRLT